jgi:multimeric flavodoxin WrbA
MNVLVINGSPRGKSSNTLKITNAFIEGLNTEVLNDVEVIDVKNADISPCRGCFCCWLKTPGKCVIKDDMEELIKKYVSADIIIWSFPLFYFGMPSIVKTFLDRTFPANLPELLEDENGSIIHPSRYDLSHQKYVLISTCGFPQKENNYDALFKQFNLMYDDYSSIICPEGELFRVKELNDVINQYLSIVKKAGEEYSTQFEIKEETVNKLDTLLFPKEDFVRMANESWKN